MQGLMLSELAWSEPGGQTAGSRRRRHHRVYAAVLLPLLCLLGVLALVAYRQGWPLYDTRGQGTEALSGAGWKDPTRAAGIPDYDISGWIETAGLNGTNGTATLPTLPGPFPYIINEENKCPGGEEPPFLVLLITVEAHQVERRDAIRRTWGAEKSPLAGPRVVRLFLLGVKKEEEEEEEQGGGALEEESLRHGDILQQDFVDSYHNLTAKTLMGLNWVARHCPRAAYVMKTDSDVFVNTEYLVHELLHWPHAEPRRNVFTGCVFRGNRPVRNRDSKWYVSEEEYPSPTYPDYCVGTGYVFSGELAALIYNGSLDVPRFPYEDVHVGMVLERLRVPIAPPPSPSLFRNEGLRPFDVDGYSRLVTSHHVTPQEMLDFWSRLRPAAEARYRRSSVLAQNATPVLT